MGTPKRPDLAGRVFGRLTVVGFLERRGKHNYWSCNCSCGGTAVVRTDCLYGGIIRSCKCLQAEESSARARIHGKSHTPAYNTWRKLIQRCQNPTDIAFRRYGGRGITVCDRWSDFENFLADMGQPPPGKTLDRKNNDGPYSPDNCRWATKTEQMRNMSTNRVLTRYDGTSHLLIEWAEITGKSSVVIFSRIKRGWSVDDALDIPNGMKR